jgi:hypothetical protein
LPDSSRARGFPRTYHVYGGWTQAEALAKYDMVVGYANYDLGFLRSQNPNGIFLLQPGLTPTDPADYTGVQMTYGHLDKWAGGCDELSGGVNLGCIRAFDPYWDYLRNADGTIAGRDGGISNHPGWNLADPAGKGSAEMVAKVFAYAGKRSGLYTDDWDGLHSDNWIYTIGGSSFYGPTLDTDRNGAVDDYGVLRRNWSNGLAGAGHTLRRHLPGKVIGGNGIWWKNPGAYVGSEVNGWLKSANYTLIEHFDRFYDDPGGFLRLARRWLDHPDPYGQPRYLAVMQRALTADGSPLELSQGIDPNSEAYMLDPAVMRSMRWGLTLAMMGDAYYEIFVDRMHHTRWWYDEFDGGEGIRRRGYLGQALSAPRLLAPGVRQRDFENGIALNNSSDAMQAVRLGGDFWKLTGTQNPSLNDGSRVTTVSVPAHDGLILLRNDDAS